MGKICSEKFEKATGKFYYDEICASVYTFFLSCLIKVSLRGTHTESFMCQGHFAFVNHPDFLDDCTCGKGRVELLISINACRKDAKHLCKFGVKLWLAVICTLVSLPVVNWGWTNKSAKGITKQFILTGKIEEW